MSSLPVDTSEIIDVEKLRIRIAPDVDPVTRCRILEDLAREGESSSPSVERVAREVLSWMHQEASLGNRVTTRRGAELALREVQLQIPYVPDPSGDWDYYQPAEQTARRGGDCEDMAVFLVAVLRRLRIRARVVWQPEELGGAPMNHVTVQALVGGKWLWAEPSVKGARLGEEPHAAAQRLGKVSEVYNGRPLVEMDR